MLTTQNIYILIASFSLIILMLFIINIVLFSKIKKLNKRFDKFINSCSDEFNVEDLLTKIVADLRDSNHNIGILKESIDDINKKYTLCIQKTGVIRYNPFQNVGGELCFALALLDYNNDGCVINTIFTEAGCYTYCKAIFNGESSVKLSKEEEEAITLAKNKAK